MEKQPCVYILSNMKNGTLYTGVTSNLIKRIWEHRSDITAGFTGKYQLHSLVWYEIYLKMESAIQREKNIKNWRRSLKVDMVEKHNPDWRDLYPGLI